MHYEIRYVQGHVEVYIGSRFVCSADTAAEARAMMAD